MWRGGTGTSDTGIFPWYNAMFHSVQLCTDHSSSVVVFLAKKNDAELCLVAIQTDSSLNTKYLHGVNSL